MKYEYNERPSVDELLERASVKSVIKDHNTKPRINYLVCFYL